MRQESQDRGKGIKGISRQRQEKKKTSEQHCNRLGEPDPRWEEGLEGSGKRQTVEPRRFKCTLGESLHFSVGD